MANTIAIVPGTGFGPSVGNIFLTVLVIILSAAVILWLLSLIPGVKQYVPFLPAQA